MFEFIRIGAYVKVIAIDELSGMEVSMVGDRKKTHEIKQLYFVDVD